MAVWSFAFMFFHSAPDKKTCSFWFNIASLGYCTYYSLGLHFALLLTDKEKIIEKWWVKLALYVPSLFFIYKALNGELAADDFVLRKGIWYQILPLDNIYYLLYVIVSVTCLAAGFIILYLWRRKVNSQRKKKQAITLIITGVTPLALGINTNIILPALQITIIPAIADILLLAFVIGIAYSIKKYKLMVISPEIAANEIISNVIDMIILTDNSGKITQVNESVVHILKYSNEDIMGKAIETIISEKSIIELINKYNTLNSKFSYSEETSFFSKLGEKIPVRLSISNIFDDDLMLGMVFILQDMRHIEQLKNEIEEKIMLADSLIQSNEKLKELDKLKSDFLSTISHELRTPLNLILSTLQLTNLNMDKITNLDFDKDKFKKHNGIMKQNCYRLLRLVNNLIDVTKIDAGYFNINLSNNNIVNVVEEITLSVAEYIESKGISLLFDTDIEERIMACDPDKMERIMLNLIANAVKFTEAGGNIFVNIQDLGESISISVKDTGIGISKEKQELIFERFIQIDTSLTRSKEGSGIGLSLVKSLVEMHKGNIKVESEPNKGSEFIITLPVYKIDENDGAIKTYGYNIQENIEKIHIEFSDIYF
jgi:PAS domain S-box